MFFIFRVKHKEIQSEELIIYDEYFEESMSVWFSGENIVKEYGISDRFFEFL